MRDGKRGGEIEREGNREKEKRKERDRRKKCRARGTFEVNGEEILHFLFRL